MTKGETEECTEEKTTRRKKSTREVQWLRRPPRYRRLPCAAKTKELEAVFFNRAVQFLDYMFVHHLRAIVLLSKAFFAPLEGEYLKLGRSMGLYGDGSRAFQFD